MGRREVHLNSKAANLHADRIIFMTWFPVCVCVFELCFGNRG